MNKRYTREQQARVRQWRTEQKSWKEIQVVFNQTYSENRTYHSIRKCLQTFGQNSQPENVVQNQNNQLPPDGAITDNVVPDVAVIDGETYDTIVPNMGVVNGGEIYDGGISDNFVPDMEVIDGEVFDGRFIDGRTFNTEVLDVDRDNAEFNARVSGEVGDGLTMDALASLGVEPRNCVSILSSPGPQHLALNLWYMEMMSDNEVPSSTIPVENSGGVATMRYMENCYSKLVASLNHDYAWERSVEYSTFQKIFDGEEEGAQL